MGEPNAGELTRRGFLRGLGTSAAGLTVIGSAGLFIKNQAIATQAADAQAKTEPAKPAFAYVKIDPDKAVERAYTHYFKGG